MKPLKQKWKYLPIDVEKPLGKDYVTGQFARPRYIISQLRQNEFNSVCLDNLLCVYPLMRRSISTKTPEMF